MPIQKPTRPPGPNDRYCNQCGASWSALPTKVIHFVCPFCGADKAVQQPTKKPKELIDD